MSWTIEEFWRPRLSGIIRQDRDLDSPGWELIPRGDAAFVEAGLSLDPGPEALTQPIWLIAAPGAVGKSTLAREICAATGAVYVDLARSKTVGGAHLTGELYSNHLHRAFADGQTTLVIDALDEARLRVTSQAFEDFIDDVAKVAKSGRLPLVLAGRVGIIDEVWALLATKHDIEAPLMYIDLFDEGRAELFITKALGRHAAKDPHLAGSLRTHPEPYRETISHVVKELTILSGEDGRRFSGYAPVLEAVAKVLSSETNPARIAGVMENLLDAGLLRNLSNAVLKREANKLRDSLAQQDPAFPVATLYQPDEQLTRLGARLWNVTIEPTVPAALTAAQQAVYEDAVGVFLEQHPFLDGTGRAPAGAVFGASVLSHALRSTNEALAAASVRSPWGRAKTPNPFLADFYLDSNEASQQVPTDDLGLVFESIQAKALPGESVRFLLEADETEDVPEVEIVVSGNDETRTHKLTAPTSGPLRFGGRVHGITIDAPNLDVEVGNGDQLDFVAPVSLTVRTLLINAETVEFRSDERVAEGDEVITLEAKGLIAPNALVLRTRGKARVAVTWPDSKAYPWTTYSQAAEDDIAGESAEALRALRRLVISFRSHSKGQLARFKGKIEHTRMTKGRVGVALRERLLRDGVLSVDDKFYILHPDRLGAVVGMSFGDAKLRTFSAQTREYLRGLD